MKEERRRGTRFVEYRRLNKEEKRGGALFESLKLMKRGERRKKCKKGEEGGGGERRFLFKEDGRGEGEKNQHPLGRRPTREKRGGNRKKDPATFSPSPSRGGEGG